MEARTDRTQFLGSGVTGRGALQHRSPEEDEHVECSLEKGAHDADEWKALRGAQASWWSESKNPSSHALETLTVGTPVVS